MLFNSNFKITNPASNIMVNNNLKDEENILLTAETVLSLHESS